jgi:hypothetical protein
MSLDRGEVMLVAKFGPSTGWVGKTITHEDGVFILQDHGPITSESVMYYDQQGHLEWAGAGMRAWVGAMAATPTRPGTATNTVTLAPGSRVATFGPSTGWAGKAITYDGEQYHLEGVGPVSLGAVLDYDRQGHLIWESAATKEWVRAQRSAGSLTLMWIVAVSPLVVGLLMWASAAAVVLYVVPFVLCLVDRDNLRKAGVDVSWLILWILLFVPVFIYLRLRRTQSSLIPLYLWTACFAASLFIPVAAYGGA